MGKRYVQSIVGWMIVAGHFGIAGMIWFVKDWDIAVKQSAVLTLAPVTAGYLTAVVRAWQNGQTLFGPGERVNLNYAFISLLIPTILFAFLLYTIQRFPQENFVQTEQLQQWLAGAELVFAGTVGFIIADLFGSATANTVLNPPVTPASNGSNAS